MNVSKRRSFTLNSLLMKKYFYKTKYRHHRTKHRLIDCILLSMAQRQVARAGKSVYPLNHSIETQVVIYNPKFE
jgi:hypothetical protein